MADKVFVDSNVLLRATFAGMNDHEACQATLDRLIDTDHELWISHQVIREFCVNATREDTFVKESAPQPNYNWVVDVVDLLPVQFSIADEDANVRREFHGLMRRERIVGKQLHDANIVATMQVNDIDTLVTRNERHFRRFPRIRLLSPKKDRAL